MNQNEVKLLEKLRQFPFLLAPMASITNAPFRLLMKEMGAEIVISELISATGLQYGGKKTIDLCRYFEEERPVGLQIFGEGAEHLGLSAEWIEKHGADFVDINLGCPVPKVVNKGAGAALTRNPEKLFQVLSHVKNRIQIPLTIKIRTGWDSCSVNAMECVLAAAEAGVTWVAIHGRTRAQGYEGSANWDLISEVKAKSPIPIIGNGDILTADHALSRLQTSKCDAVMIGRGVLRNPFLFFEIAKKVNHRPSLQVKTYWQLVERHIELLKKTYSDFYVGIQLRKFATWYSAGIEGASAFRKKLYEQTNDETGTQKVVDLVREFFDKPNVCKSNSFLSEPFLKGGHG
ncbi:MAG: tRNA dihydrouridine synthase [Bacteriovoracia bacterium]